MCMCVGSYKVNEGIEVPPKSPGSWTARQCPVRKLGGAWTALVPVGSRWTRDLQEKQTNRTDQTRLQSYDLEWTCWLFPGPTGKLTKLTIRKIFCLNTGQHQGSYLISQLQHALVDLVNRAMVKEASLDNFVSNISNKSYINIGCK